MKYKTCCLKDTENDIEDSKNADQNIAQIDCSWDIVQETTVDKDSNFVGFYNDTFGISVGYAGAVSHTEDGGKTWTPGENSSMCRFCLDIVDENLAWCGGNGNGVRVTKDGGRTWTAVTDTSLSTIQTNIDFLDDTTGWISTTGDCASTNDGGQTWNIFKLPDNIKEIAGISLRTANDGYILSNDGILFITNDGGSTWTEKPIGLNNFNVVDEKGNMGLYLYKISIADMNFYDENNGTLVLAGLVNGEGTKVWCLNTTDGGESWTSEELPMSDGMKVSTIYLSPDGNTITIGSLEKQMEILKKKI